MLKTYINSTNYIADKAAPVKAKMRNEEGEVASWLILAAGLAFAAAAASTVLKDVISGLAADVQSEAGNG